MRGNYYRFAKVDDNTWQGYGPGRVTTFIDMDAETMDSWNDYVIKFNKNHPDSLIDKTEYFNYMIAEIW